MQRLWLAALTSRCGRFVVMDDGIYSLANDRLHAFCCREAYDGRTDNRLEVGWSAGCWGTTNTSYVRASGHHAVPSIRSLLDRSFDVRVRNSHDLRSVRCETVQAPYGRLRRRLPYARRTVGRQLASFEEPFHFSIWLVKLRRFGLKRNGKPKPWVRYFDIPLPGDSGDCSVC